MATLIKPHVDAAWWHKSIDLIEAMAAEVPFFEMRFDKSGAIVEQLRELARELAAGRVTA